MPKVAFRTTLNCSVVLHRSENVRMGVALLYSPGNPSAVTYGGSALCNAFAIFVRSEPIFIKLDSSKFSDTKFHENPYRFRGVPVGETEVSGVDKRPGKPSHF